MPLIPMTIQQQLARHIKSKRKLLRLTQAELAEQADTSQAVIARIEKAEGNPGADLIQRIITALDFEMVLYVRPQHPQGVVPDWLKQP